jgi:diguanylate cyclase (GGDEF)-like protein
MAVRGTEVIPGVRLRLAFTGVIAFLAAAALYASVLIIQRQAVLESESRYNITWLTNQAGVELSRFESVVAASQIPGSDVDRDDVETWLEIVENRVKLLHGGEVGEFIRVRPELASIAADLTSGVAAARPLVATLDQPGNAGKLLALLRPLNSEMVRLSARAYDLTNETASQQLRQLTRLQWAFSGLLGSLIICGFCLIGALSWHNRLLKRKHAEIGSLVVDLQRTGTDLASANASLAEANDRVRGAMAEAQLHNQILRARDSELHTQNARFDAALNNMSQALCMVDAGQRLIVCNLRFRELFGLPTGAVRSGLPVSDVFRAIVGNARYDRRIIDAIRLEQQSLAVTRRPLKFFQEDDEGRALAVSHQPMEDGGWVATYEDISERRRAEARIRFMAHHDALTSLPNRLLFHERMKAALEEERRSGTSLAVLCLDLDYFKGVNDTLGHSAGDALLEAVAQRLLGCIRESDLVARLGGDEFAILHFSDHQPEDAEALAKRIVETLRQPYEIDGQPAIVSVSIGIAVADEDETSAELLLKCADMALYRAKADGRSTYRFFETEMDAEVQARRAIELDLREALARSQLEVFYQPLFELEHGRVSGFEALLRWRHPQRGMISPATFIPIAEDLRLIGPIGEWVLRRACADAASWPDHVAIAVNLSPMQFRGPDLVQTVQRALSQSGLPARRLEIEITESALLQQNDKVLATLHRLRDLGVRIALDDFGTGYSSLSYLRSFPFDKIKIDQSFVREIGSRPDCLAIVTSVASLARRLGMTTTAEGVETAEQVAELRSAGCTEVQGFYFDPPMPLASTLEWFEPRVRTRAVEPV